MKLIRAIEVEKFRSCDSVRLQDVGDVTALVGPNNSGKSNVLRALHLFFNDETDPGVFIDFDVDYRLGLASKKKKSISVCVEFELPDKFRFRKGLGPVAELLGRRFWVRKTWTLYLDEPVIEIREPDGRFRRVVADESDRVTHFLNLISFRYVPNRAIPAQVIREQSRGVLRQLARRLLARSGRDVTPILDNMRLVAKEMVAPIAADLTRVCGGISDLELSTPGSVFDMLSQAGFRAGVGAYGQIDDTSLGAGVQNILMFHVLYMIDQGEFQGFGWRQAAIWAVEEPESALHRHLQVRLASLLRAYALPSDSRFQILLTTHNDVFVYGATSGFLVSLDESPASIVQPRPILSLAREAASQEVTSLPSPALQFPFDTVVVTEGDIDAEVLSQAARLTGMCDGVRFVTPCHLDPGAADGVEGVQRFLTRYRHVLPQRLSGHPLLVLLDWEVTDGKVQTIATKYGDGGTVNVRRMDANAANPLVGDSFKGIERFYSVRILEGAQQAGIVTFGRMPNQELVARPRELANAKAALREFFCATATEADCDALRPALAWIESVRRGGLV